MLLFIYFNLKEANFLFVTPLHSSSSVTDIVMEEAPITPILAPLPPLPLTARPMPPAAHAPPASSPMPPANIAITPCLPPPPPPPHTQASQPERDSRRGGSVGGGCAGGGGGGGGGRMGLTKEVLSAHTQQEEQAFLDRFKDLSKLRVFDQTASSTVRCHTPAALSRGRGTVLLPDPR